MDNRHLWLRSRKQVAVMQIRNAIIYATYEFFDKNGFMTVSYTHLDVYKRQVLTIFLSTLFGWDVLQPVHLLWINLVTDTFPAIALGVEPAEPGVMTHKPRGRKSSFFSGGVLSSIIYQGVLQAAIVMSVYGLAIAYPCLLYTSRCV